MTLVGGTPAQRRSGGRYPPPPASDGTWPADQAGAAISMIKQLERALDLSDRVDRDPRVARGRVDVAMAEQVLDHTNIDALLQQMRGEAVAQRVRGDDLASRPARRPPRERRAARSAS